MRVDVWRSKVNGQWYVAVIGDNGENVLSSEGHMNKGDATDIATKAAPPGATVRVIE